MNKTCRIATSVGALVCATFLTATPSARALTFRYSFAPSTNVGAPVPTSISVPSTSVEANDLVVVWVPKDGTNTVTDSAGDTFKKMYLEESTPGSTPPQIFFTVTKSFTGSLTISNPNGIQGCRIYSGYSNTAYVNSTSTVNPYPMDSTSSTLPMGGPYGFQHFVTGPITWQLPYATGMGHKVPNTGDLIMEFGHTTSIVGLGQSGWLVPQTSPGSNWIWPESFTSFAAGTWYYYSADNLPAPNAPSSNQTLGAGATSGMSQGNIDTLSVDFLPS